MVQAYGSWFGRFRHRTLPEGRALHSAKAPCGSQPLGSYAAALAPSKGRLIRCTVLGSTPKRFAIFRTPSVRPGAFRAVRIRASSSGAIRGQAEALTLLLGSPKPGADSLNDRTLELGKDTKHLKHGL